MGGCCENDVAEKETVVEAWYRVLRSALDHMIKPSQHETTSAAFEWTRLGTRYAQVLSSVC